MTQPGTVLLVMVALEGAPCVRIFPRMTPWTSEVFNLPPRVKSRTAGRGQWGMVGSASDQ
jgi:hypothetical protein